MDKNFNRASVLFEIEKAVQNFSEIKDYEVLIDQFLSVDEGVREKYFSHLYLSMWKVALNLGKLELAKTFAKKALQYLFAYKRIPQIKIFIQSLHETGLFKKNSAEYLRKADILVGKKNNLLTEDFHNFELMEDHPEHWKEFPEFLKQFLLVKDEWTSDDWKLCYEMILMIHFDKDLFLKLSEKARELKKQ